MHILTRALTVLTLVGSIVACSAPASKPEPTLYSRLGGKEAISAVVGKLYTVVAADERINGRFVDVSADKFGPLLTDFLCEAAGGPCQYKGRDMKSTHTGMNLTDAEFDALAEDAIAALDHFKVPKRESSEVINMLASLRGDVVAH